VIAITSQEKIALAKGRLSSWQDTSLVCNSLIKKIQGISLAGKNFK